MKVKFIGGAAHGRFFEVEDGRFRIEIIKNSSIKISSALPLIDPPLRDQTEHYTAQRWVYGDDLLTFFVFNGLPDNEAGVLIRQAVAASGDALSQQEKQA